MLIILTLETCVESRDRCRDICSRRCLRNEREKKKSNTIDNNRLHFSVAVFVTLTLAIMTLDTVAEPHVARYDLISRLVTKNTRQEY